MKFKIGIVGTRGIPNNYGGFEQFAEYVSVGLVKKGHDVTVYCPKNHEYKLNEFNGVKLIKCADPTSLGTFSQFIYDFNCILDSKKRGFDIVLQLGYTSSSIWNFMIDSKVLFTNMDGLEWKRSKYSKPVQSFLKFAEKLAVKNSRILISDSIGIQKYIKNKYQRDSYYIPYGAEFCQEVKEEFLQKYNLEKYSYNMILARMEPENNIFPILEGVVNSDTNRKILVIGNINNAYGKFLVDKFSSDERIVFVNGVYNYAELSSLRYYSNIYFHGHSVGGTNPSLLEAMASSAFICANKNDFNEAILGSDAFYFSNSSDVLDVLNIDKLNYSQFIENNLAKVKLKYDWDIIIKQYEDVFLAETK